MKSTTRKKGRKSTISKRSTERTMEECADDPKTPGNSPIVRVTFSTAHEFEFSCTEVLMRAAGQIQMHQAKPTKRWVFVCPTNLDEPEFHHTTAADGKTMTIDDKCTQLGEFHYGVTVRETGRDYNSDDHRHITNPPMIRNQ